ncbi:MAG: hypothetical protein EXR98_15930 [Gemmataceae bacterium]|nr:hypothetical protein [Gemmataceae bacterium]
MAQPATVDEFIDLVRKSGVADEKRLDAYLAKMRATFPPEPTKVAGLFVHDGILTNFQAENILAGKWRRFSIGKYKVLERLGSGGFAQVYLCEHKLMRRRVAVKVLPVAKAKDSSAKERFYREARAAAALDHPNIVHTYDIDQDEDLHFLVMEYVDGANLLEIVQKSGPLSVLRACHYIQHAALALQHAYEHELVHRDIKPGNILVDRAGIVKILDMGLALILSEEDDQLTKKHDDGTLGTADYLSPEQAMNSHDVDIRTDIYSLGVTFYFLLTGQAPFENMAIAQKLMAHQMKQPRPIAEIRKDVPAAVVAILDKMMAKKVEARYSVPGEVVEALAPFTQTPIGPPSDSEMPRLSPAAGGESADAAAAKIYTPGRNGPGSAKGIKAAAVSPATPVPGTVKAKPAAPPITQPAPAPATGITEELAPWQKPAPTADDPSFEVDALASTSSGTRHGKRAAADSKRSMFLMITLVGAFVIIPIILVAGAAVFWFRVVQPPSEQVKPGPPRFEVSKDPTRKNAKRSIKAALKDAETGSVIELWDVLHEENVVIEPTAGRTAVTIQAAEGKEIVWRSARKDPEAPILRLSKAAGFKLKGKGIIFDGTIDQNRRVIDLITINLESPGLALEDVQINHFERSGIVIMNSGGTEKAPMTLSRLFFLTDVTPKTRGAIYFDANPQVFPSINDHISIDEWRFHGFDREKTIQVNQPKDKTPVNGNNVRY